MRASDCVGCPAFPCRDVDHAAYSVPAADVDPEAIRVVLVSETSPRDPADGYYADGDPLFARTTVAAFRAAGAAVSSVGDVLRLGVYLTPAVKCAKTAYGVAGMTVDSCAALLADELDLFPRVRAYLLMGDVAIRGFNRAARLRGQARVVPPGSTYRIRAGTFTYRGARVFPSYLQAGPSFFIEKTKRRAIAEDIARALAVAAG